jgi:hypothetical protein
VHEEMMERHREKEEEVRHIATVVISLPSTTMGSGKITNVIS